MRIFHRALLAGSLSLVVGFVAGCGASGAGLLTGSQASVLQNQLNQISSALSAGHCGSVRSATRSLAGQVASLPDTVSVDLRQALTSEANQVSSLAVSQCRSVASPSSTTTTAATTTNTTPTTATTPTTPTSTSPTTSTPTTTPTTPTAPATTPTTPGNTSGGVGPPAGAGNNGNGNGNGNGG